MQHTSEQNSLFSSFKDPQFTGKLKAIAIPVALQNIINFGVNALDTIMLGRLGEVQLSAAHTSNQLSFMFMILSGALAAGCGVLAAQYWGRQNVQRVREIVSFMYRLVAVMSLFFAGVAIFVPHVVLGFIIKDAEVVRQGVIYLRVMGIGYLFTGFTNSTIGILRSTGTVKISVYVYSSSLFINLFFNYVLIFGKFGFPRLEVLGAAIATVMARVFEFGFVFVYLFCFDKAIQFKPRHLLHTGEGVAHQFLIHSSPVLINEIFWTAANFLVGVIIGRMGREFVAANSISGLMMQFAGIGIIGISSAAGSIIGNTIGEGDYDRARHYAKGLMAFSFVVGVVACGAIQVMRLFIIDFYNISPMAKEYARQLTMAVSFIVIAMSVSSISMMGTLRGGGDTKFVMFMDVIFVWIIAIPLGAMAGLVWKLPVWMVYVVLKSEDLFKMFVVLYRIPSGKWLKDVTRQ